MCAVNRGEPGSHSPRRPRNARTGRNHHHRTIQSTTGDRAGRRPQVLNPKDRNDGSHGPDEAHPTWPANNHKRPSRDPTERNRQDCNLRRTRPQGRSPTRRRHAPTKTWNPMQGDYLLSCHSNLSSGFVPTTQRWADIEQTIMPAHELQLTCGRRVNPIQHYQIPRSHGNQPEGQTERRNRNERFRIQSNQFQF